MQRRAGNTMVKREKKHHSCSNQAISCNGENK